MCKSYASLINNVCVDSFETVINTIKYSIKTIVENCAIFDKVDKKCLVCLGTAVL